MSIKMPGDRVGAILGGDKSGVRFLGYGVYLGRKRVPVPDLTFLEDNPCIKLDSGRYVWGFQCWWGSEESIKAKLEGWNLPIENVEIDNLPPDDDGIESEDL